MKKLKEIYIENFRTFQSINISEFGNINLFIGKNNTGKSTLLEAIYLNLTHGYLDLLGFYPFNILFHRRGILANSSINYTEIDNIDDIVFSVIFYLLNSEALKKTSRENFLNLKIKSNLKNLELKVYFSNFPDNIFYKIQKFYSRYKILFNDQSEKFEIFPHLAICDLKGNLIFSLVEIPSLKKLFYSLHTPSILKLMKNNKVKVILIDEFISRTNNVFSSPIMSFLKKLEKHIDIDKQNLKKFLSKQLDIEIEDITPKIFDIFLKLENKSMIPISLLGDGSKLSLFYYYALSLKNSFILLEEPENHLHPGLMNEIVNLIIKSSNTNQIFITTHNLEFLQKILEKASKEDINLKIFSFKRNKNSNIDIQTYSCKEANIALNKIGVDLR